MADRAGRLSGLGLGVALALALHFPVCVGQNAPPTADAHVPASYRIAGRMVSALDGHPLARAAVQILNTKTRKPVASTIADADGGFAFARVAPGGFSLEAKMPGYLAATYEQHGNFSTAIITGAGVDTESLVFKLIPDADLSGRVIDEAGDPVRRASVALYRESRDAGVVRISRVRSAQTDDLGVYDMAQLAPGRYFLSATGTPWYAVHPRPESEVDATGIVASVDRSLDVAYPTTFYADATDSSAAAAIPLRGGEQVEADLRLSPQPAVTITIPHAPDDKSVRFPQLQRAVFGEIEWVNGEVRGSQTGYSMVGLAPGQYVLRQVGSDGAATHSTKVDLTAGNVETRMDRGEESGRVKLLLKAADGAKLPPRLRVMLSAGSSMLSVGGESNERSEAEIGGVEPGQYRVDVYGGQRAYYVTKVSSEGRDGERNQLRVEAGATSTATVVVSAGAVTIEGFASQAGKAAAGAMVLLLPVDATPHVELFWEQQTDLDGSFDLGGVPTGRYTLLAIADGWDLEWKREEVLARYLPLAVPVVISEGGRTPLKLHDVLVVQPR